jgi:hypothetical protein
MKKPTKKPTGAINDLLEKLSKGEAVIVGSPKAAEGALPQIIKVVTKRGTVLVDEATGTVVTAQGIWREGKPDVGIVDGAELINLDDMLMEMRLNNPMAANLVHKYFLDRKK